ncbi:MAG: hypothetical protein WKG01_07630, partial [Kofleriaceae bacterium]
MRLLLACALAGCSFSPPGASEDATVTGDWKLVTSGWDHTCAIRTDDSLWCWGDNSSGQVGIASESPEIVVPTRVGDRTWTAVTAGEGHTCAIATDGAAWCWGLGTSGQLGVMMPPENGTQREPIAVEGSWKAIAAGFTHTCAISATDQLWCWGANGSGEAGDTQAASPIPRMVSPAGWLAVTTGTSTTCGIKSDQSLWCTGSNVYGVLGDGTNTSRAAFAQVDGKWSQVSTRVTHACGVRSDGKLRCWGANAAGQLGDGTITAQYTPRAVGGD